MTSFTEGHLQFEFGLQWEVVKLDAHHAYRQGIEKLDHTKAVDFLALWDKQILYFLEVKDFRNHRIENEKRLTTEDLTLEWGHKVRDSLACIVGAYRQSEETIWGHCLDSLQNKKQDIKVVLWLEYDPPRADRKRQQVQASIGQNVLKKKFKWLTNRVLIVNLNDNSLSDLKVQNLPHA